MGPHRRPAAHHGPHHDHRGQTRHHGSALHAKHGAQPAAWPLSGLPRGQSHGHVRRPATLLRRPDPLSRGHRSRRSLAASNKAQRTAPGRKAHSLMPGLDQFGYKEQLRRVLTTGDLIIYGLIFMVPIAPFSVYGFVWDDAKGMVPLAYLVGLVGMVFTAMSYAAMSRAYPLAGAVYTYAGRGLHEAAGFFSGWLILLDYMLVPSLLYLFSAVALRPLVPAVPTWLWLGGFIAFNAA